MLLHTLYNFSAEVFFQREIAISWTSFILFHGRRILKTKREFLDVKTFPFEKSARSEFQLRKDVLKAWVALLFSSVVFQ